MNRRGDEVDPGKLAVLAIIFFIALALLLFIVVPQVKKAAQSFFGVAESTTPTQDAPQERSSSPLARLDSVTTAVPVLQRQQHL